MMYKRNTEGYVLAYLLIVIAVMGAIAATLMTSTVQVMAAQQNSIRYMQDKYEAMGEVEKLVAELDYKLSINAPTENSDYVAEYHKTGIEEASLAFAEVTSIIGSILENSDDSSSDLSLSDIDLNTRYEKVATLRYASAQDTGTLTAIADLNIPYILIVESYPDKYYDEDEDKYVDDTDYEYSLFVKAPNIISYEITQNGGVT